MRPGPVLIVRNLLSEFPITAAPRDLRSIIRDIVLEKGWEAHSTVALERAETWEGGVQDRMTLELNELQRLGRPARIAFNSSSDELVQGACFVEPGDSPEVAEQKRRRSRLGDYLEIIRGLTPDQFELLCGKVIGLLGVDSPRVTRRSGDEGIDFYGRILGESVFFPKDLQPTIQRQLSIWIVGQAKQYLKTQAGTPEVRDIVGAVTLGRGSAAFGDSPIFPDLKIRVSDPVFTLLVTGGTLSSHAWKLLDRSGVIGIDGEILAAFLADRDPGLGDDPTREEFLAWLGNAI